ncbi:MAG: zinc ABC transporter substrate-binding protein [Rhodospirillaceae bacterium]|nr:zinc ABC transporter substrate-binding protein [Rhodospirillaceae bacterium]
MLRVFFAALVGSFLMTPLTSQAEVNVFACEPEWAALTKEIGGNKVQTFTATHAKQNPHFIRARPSLIAKARRADLIICSGAGLEVGWLPILVQKAGAAVQPGSIGHLMTSEYVPIIEKPTVVDRSLGDLHPEGNPHVHLNPHNILLIADELAKRLEAINPKNSAIFKERLLDFKSRWRKAIVQWEQKSNFLRGSAVVVHHKSFSYLIKWLGLNRVGSLEPKPGIPPTSLHLEKLLQKLDSEPADLIIRTPYDPGDASEWLSKKSGTTVLILPYTIGGDSNAIDLFSLFDRSLALLVGAVVDQ